MAALTSTNLYCVCEAERGRSTGGKQRRVLGVGVRYKDMEEEGVGCTLSLRLGRLLFSYIINNLT